MFESAHLQSFEKSVISSQLLFLFSALGAVNGILAALYLFTRQSQRMTHYLLGGLLLAISFRTVKSTFYYFNPDLAILFIQLGLAACLLIGPLTYLYVHSQLADLKQETVADRWRWHGLLPLLAIAAGAFFPYSRSSDAWYYAICAMHFYWFLYLLWAGKELWQSRSVLLGAERKLSYQAVFLLSVYVISFLILAAYVSTPFTSYIVGALSFTFSVHISILYYIVHHGAESADGKKEKYQGRRLTDDDAQELLNSLNKVMHEQKLYLNPGLSLALLAKK
ncbi:MAG: hypothetical protein ABW202_01855, partial [Duganella sp.]